LRVKRARRVQRCLTRLLRAFRNVRRVAHVRPIAYTSLGRRKSASRAHARAVEVAKQQLSVNPGDVRALYLGAGVRGPARTEKDRFGLGGASPRARRRGFRRSVQRRLRPRPQTHGNGAVSIACCRAVYSPSWPALLVANGFVYRLGPSSMSYNKEHRP